jgi:hypothetical protein
MTEQLSRTPSDRLERMVAATDNHGAVLLMLLEPDVDARMVRN